MMKIVLKFILFCVFMSPVHAKNKKNWEQLSEIRTVAALDSFKKTCNKVNAIPFESNQDATKVLKDIAKSGGIFTVRALIFAESNCTDGADRELLVGVLGNEMLISHAAQLIKALFLEKKWKELATLPEQENEEWFTVDCNNPKCKADRKAYYQQKRSALTRASIDKKEEVVRSALLNALKSYL